MGKGLGLNINNDLLIQGTQFMRTSDADRLAQKLRCKLQLIEGESQLDDTAGLPYFSDIFVKPVDIAGVASLYKSEILDTEGVQDLLSFTYDLDTTQRLFTLSFSVNTIYGEIELNSLQINLGV